MTGFKGIAVDVQGYGRFLPGFINELQTYSMQWKRCVFGRVSDVREGVIESLENAIPEDIALGLYCLETWNLGLIASCIAESWTAVLDKCLQAKLHCWPNFVVKEKADCELKQKGKR